MTVETLRTNAKQAAIWFFDRPLHPELFLDREAVEYEFPGGTFRASITDDGHVVRLRRGAITLTEVFGVFTLDDFPEIGLVAATKAISGRDIVWESDPEFGPQVNYTTSVQLETVDAEVFERLDRELTLDSRDADLSCRLGSGNRLDPSAVSVVRIEPLDGAISVHATHTFPGERAVVRTQTLVELKA